jgi:hypothetical protein
MFCFFLVYPKVLLYPLSKLGEIMKKIIMTGLVCLSVCIPLQLSAQSLLERVAVDVVLGAYDKPKYQDERPYYFYKNRYYYGGEFRKGQYYYDGRRLDGGHYYERGYQDHYRKDYKQKTKKAKHPNHKNGYYKHNKHYLNEHQHDYNGKKNYYDPKKGPNKKKKNHKK